MNDSERQTLSVIIEKRIERLNVILKTGSGIDRQAKEELKNDESARLDSLNHQIVGENLYLVAKQELDDLKSNLDWLNSPVAGECEECGCSIQIKRLIVVPATRRCVNCT